MPRYDDDEDDRPRRNGRRRDRRDDDFDDEDDDRPRRRRRYDDGPPPSESNGLATAGVILGVLAFCTAGLAALPGLVCSVIAMGRPTGRTTATIGLVLNGVGGLLGMAVGIALLLPGVQKVRESAARMQDGNNQKNLFIASHAVKDQTGGFVGPYAIDPRGQVNRELSFRVSLLPHLTGERNVPRFDLSQPWNSPQNQAASSTVIKAYADPGSPSANTPYRVFYGGGALFDEDGRPVRPNAILDGTSTTIFLVHATEQVPWAAPREFPYSANTPLPALGPPGGRGANVLLADGSVRLLSPSVSERTLRALITRDAGDDVGDW